MSAELLDSLVERVVEMRTRGVVSARDTYAVMDAKTSMIMLSSKVNAIANVLIGDDAEKQRCFVQAWRNEFRDLTTRKYETVRKIINDDAFVTGIAKLLGESIDSDQLHALREIAHKANDESEALDLSILDVNAGLLDYDILS